MRGLVRVMRRPDLIRRRTNGISKSVQDTPGDPDWTSGPQRTRWLKTGERARWMYALCLSNTVCFHVSVMTEQSRPSLAGWNLLSVILAKSTKRIRWRIAWFYHIWILHMVKIPQQSCPFLQQGLFICILAFHLIYTFCYYESTGHELLRLHSSKGRRAIWRDTMSQILISYENRLFSAASPARIFCRLLS